jgi:hypothetical protein
MVPITAVENLEVVERAHDLVSGAFPEFMNYSPVINRHFRELNRLFPGFQFALCREDTGTIAALANAMPLRWDGSFDELPRGGVEWALEKAIDDCKAGVQPNLLCAFQIVIAPQFRNTGLSYDAIRHMIQLAKDQRLAALIAPVRPNRKEAFPEMPMNDYVKVRRDDGLWVDDWLRVHEKLGGQYAGVCERSFIATGTVADWEKWTGQRFAASGEYCVSGGLAPVQIDVDENRGLYVEPNVWIVHHSR